MIFQLPSRNKHLRAVLLIVLCVGIGAWIPRQLTWSPTDSLPDHLFVIRKNVPVGDIKHGDIVRFPFSNDVTRNASQKYFHTINEVPYLLKRVGCLQGETLLVNDQKEYYCDGQYLGRAKDKSLKGEILNNFTWNGPVPTGKFFAIADHKDSYDSRYIGFVDLSRVAAKAYPLF